MMSLTRITGLLLVTLGLVSARQGALRRLRTKIKNTSARDHIVGRVKEWVTEKHHRELQSWRTFAPDWFIGYRREYGKKVDLCRFLIDPDHKRYDIDKANKIPATGSTCPKKTRRKPDGYWCGFGEQSCTAIDLPASLTTHPTTKCGCNDGVFNCADYDPCTQTTQDVIRPTASPIQFDLSPPTTTTDDPFAVCTPFTSCRECLAEGCGWFGSCLPNCGFIADVACYEGDPEQQCSAMEDSQEDAQTCSEAAADCDTCTNTIQPNSGRPCLWLDFGGGSTPGCASSCGMLGCGITGGSCPAPAACPDSEAELDCSLPGTHGLSCKFGQKMCTDCDGVEQPSGPLMECGCQNGNQLCSATGCPLHVCQTCPDTAAELDCTLPRNEGIQCSFGTLMCANDCSGVESPSGPIESCQCHNGEVLCALAVCPQMLCEIGPIAIDGRPFIDHEGTMKMARAVEVNDGAQPALWSKASSPSGVTTFVSEGRRLELVDEWKRRAVGEHSSIASFAAFAIALMTNQAPPDLVQASLVAAMDELRHAQTSFEMLSLLLGGSVVEPSSLPASKHEFQQNLSTLASGVAQEGCVDETLSALVLAASVDQLQDESSVDPTLQLLAEKTTQIAKEEGSHSVLAWRTIHWVCSMEEKEACDAVLNKWFEEGRLANSGDARLDADDESSMKAWRFIYKQLVPLVTASEEKPVGESLLLDDDGSLVTSLANDIVSGVRAAVTATDEVVQTFSSPTTMNCSSGSSEEEEALRMETLPMQLSGESVALGA